VASALNYFITESYTLDDVRANRDISSFVFQVMRQAKAAKIADLHGQLTWAYNAIAPELARDIDPPDENTNTIPPGFYLTSLPPKMPTKPEVMTRLG
jgi:hypothetical protein